MATRKRTEAVKAAQSRYEKATMKRVALKLHIVNDGDILAYLDTLDNKQGYIKDLIRADMARGRRAEG